MSTTTPLPAFGAGLWHFASYVDRYATEVCLAVVAGRDVPDWVREALPGLPATMSSTSRTVAAFDRGVVDLVEAVVLAPSVGDTFRGVVVDLDRDTRGSLQVREPAVVARVTSPERPLPLGETVDARLAEASVADRKVAFVVE